MYFRLPERVSVISGDAARATVVLVSGGVGEMVSTHWCHLTDPAEGQAPVDPALGSVGRLNVRFNLVPAAYVNRLRDLSGDDGGRALGDEVGLFRRDEGLVAAHGG